MKYFIPLLLSLLVACSAPAEAHRSYIRQLTDWIPYKGKEYRLEGWFGDGILLADPVRVLLRDKDGNVSAITGIGRPSSITGKYLDIYCASLDDCWVFFDSLDGSASLNWQLNPNALALVKMPDIPPSDPKDWTGEPVGFAPKEHNGAFFLRHAGLTFLLTIGVIIVGARHFLRRRRKSNQ